MANLIGQIISWFLSLGKIVTKIIDAIFGTNWTEGLSALQDSVTGWGKTENAITLSREALSIDYRFEYGAAWDSGYGFGEGVSNKLSGLFGGGSDPFDEGNDPYANLEKIAENTAYSTDNTANSTRNTAYNTASMANSLDYAEQDLTYLRDIAEREAINRFTTAEINIQQNNENHISRDIDLDGVMEVWAADFAEKVEISAEGVHL